MVFLVLSRVGREKEYAIAGIRLRVVRRGGGGYGEAGRRMIDDGLDSKQWNGNG